MLSDCICIPDKYKKWMALLAGFLINFANSSLYTFGNMSPYIISYLREYDGFNVRYSDANWINTFGGLAFTASSLVNGILVSRFKLSVKTYILFGCLVNCIGVGLTFFAIKSSYLLTLVTYGILNGIGAGFTYLGPLSIAMKWFTDSKGLANSVILFGFGAGSILFDQIQTLYINPDNYSPDKPYSAEFPDEKYFSKSHIDLLERIPKTFLLLAGIYFGLQITGIVLLFEKKSQNVDSSASTSINDDDDAETQPLVKDDEINSLGVRYKLNESGLGLREVLKLPAFYMIVAIFSLVTVGPGFLFTYFKTFGQTFIKNDQFLATVGSVSSAFNAFGRLFWGFFIDRLPFKFCLLIINTCLIALLSTIYLTSYTGIKELYLIWVCLMYFTFCGLFVVFPTSVVRCFGHKNFISIYGCILVLTAPSSILTTFLSSLYITLGWFWFFILGCGFSLFTNILIFLFYVKKSNGEDI